MNTICSWNIGGARPLVDISQKIFGEEDLSVVVHQLQRQNPDIICLQETHVNAERSLAHDIAEKLSGDFTCTDVPFSISHTDPQYQLALSLIAKGKAAVSSVLLPAPDFPLFFKKDGRPAQRFGRPLIIADLGDLYVATLHLEPLYLFGLSHFEGQGQVYSEILNAALQELLPKDKPLVLAGDFNCEAPEKAFSFLNDRELKEVLPVDRTVPLGASQHHPDHIFVSHKLNVQSAHIIPGDLDHYLCVVEVG